MKVPDSARPYAPVVWPENIPAIYALKALNDGTADAGQQKLALEYIIHVVAKRYELTYFPDSDRDSAFAAGKAYVGDQILKLVSLKADEIQKEIDKRRKSQR